MSEEEARKKWCPESRDKVKGALAGIILAISKDNKGFEELNDLIGEDSDKCIASDCMMWRWDTWIDKGSVSNPQKNEITSDKWGYCGLAGKP